MIKRDLDATLRHLQRRLDRIKALLAWERLKRREAASGQGWRLRLHDPTGEELLSEYTLLTSGLLKTHTFLMDQGSRLAPALRRGVRRQLAQIEWQLHRLQLDRRFGGPRW